jgi:DNA-directed RNA polymerase subunit B'
MEADVYFNGKYVKAVRNPEAFVAAIREKRRKGLLPYQLNISYREYTQEITINTDNGRTRRPLIVVEKGVPKLTEKHLNDLAAGKTTIDHLVKNGVIEFLDADEEENAYIALTPKDVTKEHTHMEVDPMAMFGVPASLISYAEYNRGDRVNYGAKMIGQAIGIFSTNYHVRTDTKSNVMAYPQRPIVTTRTTSILDRYPEGQNIVIAVMTGHGYNINDAIVMNQSSIERGMFRSFYFRTYETEKRKYFGGQEDEITVPEPGTKGHRGEKTYADLDEDGIINPETVVDSDSVLIGKISPLRFLFGEEFAAGIENKRESSICVRHGEKGVVDEVVISETPDANQLIKVRVRDHRIPEIGDKFASRYGQKGVVSLLLRGEDMPFTSAGIVPDLIFNPHAIPSRLTVGHLLETLAAKTGALSGERMDASPFSHTSEAEIRKALRRMGFRDDGKQMMYDGCTGRAYEVLIFTGVCYYFKLDHMVTDKIHARSRGPVTLLTKQPTEGRAKRGGLRLGEMEQQCLLGHGAALTLKERFDSDKTSVPVCQKCGLLAVYDTAKNRAHCPACKHSDVAWVTTSYAFKLMLDELKGMGIYPRLIMEEI